MAHYLATVRGKTGKVVPGANVSVFETGTTTLADLFSDEPLTLPISNPAQADDCGRVDFYIASGEYDILIQRFDIEDTRFDDVSILENAPTGFSPKYMEARLAANQTANLARGDHVEFDTESQSSGHITLATGAGQANGIFTLPEGVHLITAFPAASFSSAGALQLRWKNTAGGNLSASTALVRPPSSTSNISGSSAATALVVVTGSPLDVVLDIIGTPTSLDSINTATLATIFSLS